MTLLKYIYGIKIRFNIILNTDQIALKNIQKSKPIKAKKAKNISGPIKQI